MTTKHHEHTDEALSRYYDEKAASLDELSITYAHTNPYKRFFYHARYGAVCRALRPRTGERILDIGCGPGYYLAGIARAGGVPVGVDIAPNYVRQARDYVSEALSGSVSQHMAAADAKHLPFADATFDAVLMTEVLEHLTDYPRSLEEIVRVLKPDGRAVITTPSRLSPLNAAFHWKARRRRYAFHEHLTELTPGEFLRAMRRHFRSVELSYANFLVPYPLDVLAEKVVSRRAARVLEWMERTCQRLPLCAAGLDNDRCGRAAPAVTGRVQGEACRRGDSRS
jgi:ubiquinone/menaquinone biosynthesis C-methylase UbiE